MCATQSRWSQHCASSGMLHDNGCFSQAPPSPGADFCLIARSSSPGHKSGGPHFKTFMTVQVECSGTVKLSKRISLREFKRAVFQLDSLGTSREFRLLCPEILHCKGEKHRSLVRAVTEETDIVLQGPRLPQFREPLVVRKPDMGSLIEPGEIVIGPIHKHKAWRSQSKSKQSNGKFERGERQYRAAKSIVKSYKHSASMVDEVIEALKHKMKSKSCLNLVMEKYSDISKSDISGILTEFQLRRDWQGALQFFTWMKEQAWFAPNSRQYTRLIGFLGREGKVDLACVYFQEMLLEKCKPDHYTFTAMVNAYGKAKMYDEALAVFSYMKAAQDPNCRPTTVSGNALVDALLKGGKYELACKIFTDMEEGKNGLDSSCIPNVVTYNILIDALCKEGHVEAAIRLLHKMSGGDVEHAISPNVSSYNTLITACGKSGLYDKVEELVEHMVAHGFEADRITYTALIDAYGKGGLCQNAENMFLGMRNSHIQADVMAYTAMIDAYAREGQHEKAESLFKMMRDSGVWPNQVTYLALMEAYGKSGLPLAAQEVFTCMEKEGYVPNVLHYSALIDAYGKVGQYKEAADVYQLMKRAGCLPNLVTLAAILSSSSKCKSWDDAKILIERMRWAGSELELALYNFLVREDNQWELALKTLEGIKEPKLLRQSLYNALMDVLWQFEMKEKAAKIVALSKQQGIYSDLFFKEEWNIDLHGLSVGGAMVALLTWLNELRLAWLWGEDVPARVRIITGKGTHSRSRTSALKSPVESLLRGLSSPFACVEETGGFSVASGESVRAWVQTPGMKDKLEFIEIEQ